MSLQLNTLNNPIKRVLYKEKSKNYTINIYSNSDTISIVFKWSKDFLGSFLLDDSLDTIQSQLIEKNINVVNCKTTTKRIITFGSKTKQEYILMKKIILSMFNNL